MRSHIAIALALGAFALSAGPSFADGNSPSLEQFVIEAAETPAQHTALANFYKASAAEARAEATRHNQMGRAYGPGRMSEHQRMKEHCDEIAKNFTATAKAFDGMAAAHEKAAAAAKSK